MSGLPPRLTDHIRKALSPCASGALFMRPYGAHTVRIIKQSDETRGPTTPVPITDDSELGGALKANTTYLVRVGLFFSGSILGNVWNPACTNDVDFASFIYHRSTADLGTEYWGSTSAGDHNGHMYDTGAFNAASTLNASQSGAKRAHGMIRTGASGGTLTVQWGGGNGQRTLRAGSFLYAREIPDSAIVIKQVDESRQSDTTMTDDDELSVALEAGETYFIDANLIFDSGAIPDFKHSFVYTGTITSVGLSEGIANAKTPGAGGAGDAFSRAWHVGTGAVLTTPTVRTRTGSDTADTIGGSNFRGVIVPATSGTLKFQWAQSVSNASNTTVHKGSYICIAKGSAIEDVFGTLIYKTSDTSRANDATPSADPDLQFTTKANKKYISELFAVFDANSTTPDLNFAIYDPQVSITVGEVLRINLGAVGTFESSTSTGITGQWRQASFLTTPTNAAPGTSTTANKNSFFVVWSHQMSGNDSSVSAYWSQNTSNATPTICRAGSWILYEEVQ